MQNFNFCSLMVFLSLFFCSTSFAEVKITHDRFTNKDTVELQLDTNLADLQLMGFISPGKPVVSFMLASSSETWSYLRCRSLIFLVGGKPLVVTTTYDGRVGRGYVTEYVEFSLPVKILRIWAKSELVEGKLCNDEFKIAGFGLEQLRRFLNAYDGKPFESEASVRLSQRSADAEQRLAEAEKLPLSEEGLTPQRAFRSELFLVGVLPTPYKFCFATIYDQRFELDATERLVWKGAVEAKVEVRVTAVIPPMQCSGAGRVQLRVGAHPADGSMSGVDLANAILDSTP